MDDETAQYGQLKADALAFGDCYALDTVQAKRIVFLPERKLAIVNPIGELEDLVRELEEETV
jgi:hypothetical protein